MASERTALDVMKAIIVCVGIHRFTQSKFVENDEVRKIHHWFEGLSHEDQNISVDFGIRDVHSLVTVYELYKATYLMFLRRSPVGDEPVALEAGKSRAIQSLRNGPIAF